MSQTASILDALPTAAILLVLIVLAMWATLTRGRREKARRALAWLVSHQRGGDPRP